MYAALDFVCANLHPYYATPAARVRYPANVRVTSKPRVRVCSVLARTMFSLTENMRTRLDASVILSLHSRTKTVRGNLKKNVRSDSCSSIIFLERV